MGHQSEVLCKIAIDALQAVRRETMNTRHRDLWDLAIARVQQTRRDIAADEEIASIRRAPLTKFDDKSIRD